MLNRILTLPSLTFFYSRLYHFSIGFNTILNRFFILVNNIVILTVMTIHDLL